MVLNDRVGAVITGGLGAGGIAFLVRAGLGIWPSETGRYVMHETAQCSRSAGFEIGHRFDRRCVLDVRLVPTAAQEQTSPEVGGGPRQKSEVRCLRLCGSEPSRR